MLGSIPSGAPHPRSAILWARLEVSAIGMMAIGMVLCALPLFGTPGEAMEDSLAATSNAFAAFILGELLCLPFASWLGDTRSRAIARPVGAALGLLSTIAGVGASNAAARVAWYVAAGIGVETAQAWIAGGAVRSPLLRRGPELLVLLLTCAVVLALEVGLYVVASGPPQGLRVVAVCCAGQAAVVVVAALYALYPPAPSTFPIG